MLDFFDPMERTRFVKIDDKTYELHVSDPYGLWTIQFPKKDKRPEVLSGQYTSFIKAEEALKSWLYNNPPEVVSGKTSK